MSNFKKTKIGKTTSVIIGLTTALWLSGAAALMPMAAGAATVDEIQAQITALLAQITSLQAQLSAVQGGSTSGTGLGYTFTQNLKVGSQGTEVTNLQTALKSDASIYPSGLVTGYFGSMTKAAVIKFQEKYASDILTPSGLAAGTGYVGAATRAKLNVLYGGAGTGTGTGTGTGGITTTGTGLTVSAGTQPNASLAPDNGTRIPFTVVKFTASNDGDIKVNSLTVERTGLANDAVFSGIILLDETGAQIGLEKTLNSNHQVVLDEPFTVKAGQTRTMTLAGNRADTSTYAGQVAYLALAAVNTSAAVNATLPITGVGHTINETLTIGSITVAKGPLDPSASNSKEVGTTGYTFSSVKMTAGSAEKVRLTSIRWNQSGSAATSDIANVKTYVDGVGYDTVVSSDGKYYTSTFGSGIVIDKGFSLEASIKGDIVNGSARTIDFDLYKRTDLALKGETYGYGINPPNGTDESGTDDGAFHLNTNPWYDAYQATISSGSITASKATSVEAQNIAINLSNQPLGGFEVEVKGESVTVASTVFHAQITDIAGGAHTTIGTDIDSVSLYDATGAVIAGPVDATGAGAYATITFTDTVTYPVGKKVYTLKGKLATNFDNNDTIAASTTPSTDWTTVKGQTTGVTITPSPTSAVTGNTMTVKAGALAISVSSVPLAQTVIAGSKQFLFANYLLDAGNSGEDVSLNSFQLEYNAGSNPTTLTNCTLNDGTTVLMTRTAALANSSTSSFSLDVPLVIPKGTTKTVVLKCDVAGSATAGNTFSWGYDATAADLSPVGKTSGQDITETETDSAGQLMTIAANGAYTVADDSTTGYTVVGAGTTGVTLLKLRFSATTEDIDIYRVALELGNVASNTPLDLVGRKVTLYDAASPTVSIGEATFSTSDFATSTLMAAGAFRIPAGNAKTMLIKGDIAAISGTVGPLIASGDLLIVKYDGDANGTANGNYGKGVSSGATIDGASSDVTPTGVRITRSYPTFAKIDLSSSERVLQTKSGATLYKFKVTANNGDAYMYKTTFTIGSSTVQATSSAYSLYAFTDSGFSTADTTFSTDGLLNANSYYNGLGANAAASDVNIVEIYMDKASATTTYKVPSGETRWFELRGTVENVESTTGSEYITVKMDGDAAFPTAQATLMLKAATADGDANNDFIWSPSSTSTTMSIQNLDFTNAYGLVGLPSTAMLTETLTSSN